MDIIMTHQTMDMECRPKHDKSDIFQKMCYNNHKIPKKKKGPVQAGKPVWPWEPAADFIVTVKFHPLIAVGWATGRRLGPRASLRSESGSGPPSAGRPPEFSWTRRRLQISVRKGCCLAKFL